MKRYLIIFIVCACVCSNSVLRDFLKKASAESVKATDEKLMVVR